MIQTVLGAMPRSAFEGQRCLPHEHIRCASNDMLACFGENWLDVPALEQTAIDVLSALRPRCNVGLYVDATPCDLGRDTAGLIRVSQKSSMPIVASTGLYFFPACLTSQRPVEELVPIFLRECRNGLDGTGAKPGMLKCATAGEISPDNAKRLATMGRVQAETGLPLYAHCFHIEDTACGQLDILADNGADLRKVVIGHSTSRMDADYLSTLLERGCYIALDQPGRTCERLAPMVAELIQRGFGKQIHLSLDHPLYSEFRKVSESGLEMSVEEHTWLYASIFENLLPELEKLGISQEQREQLVSGNVLDWLDV